MTNNNELTISEFNMATGETIERPLTEAELAQFEIDKENWEKQLVEINAKTEAKKQALAALGLSQEIINLLAE